MKLYERMAVVKWFLVFCVFSSFFHYSSLLNFRFGQVIFLLRLKRVDIFGLFSNNQEQISFFVEFRDMLLEAFYAQKSLILFFI